MHSVLFFCKKSNIMLTVLFLILIKIDSFGSISLELKQENFKDNYSKKNTNKKNFMKTNEILNLNKTTNEIYEKNLEKILEDFFLNENDEIYNDLKKEYENLKQEIFLSVNQEKESEKKDNKNYLDENETGEEKINKNSIVSINSNENEKISEKLNDYCNREINSINEKSREINKK